MKTENWKSVRLGDVCEFIGGGTPDKSNNSFWNGNIPWASVKDLKENDLFETQDFITELGLDNSSANMCKKGDLIVATRIAPGRCTVSQIEAAINQDLKIVKSDQNNSYLRYAFNYLEPVIVRKSTGATVLGINLANLKDLQIPLPPLETQKKIVAQLDKCTSIIAKHKQMVEKYDTLVKSRFVEMFGDNPIENGKWKVETLGSNLIAIDNGKSFVCSDSMRKGKYPAILKLSAVTYGEYNQYENKALLDEDMFLKNVEVNQGDLLFTRKNTPELVGMAAYVFETERNLMMPDLIFRLNVKDDINKIYLWKLINHPIFRERIRNLANGSAKSMSNISKERLQTLKIPVPPLELQNTFAAFVQQIDKSKFAVQKSLEKTETLYKALMQEYFG